VVGDHTGEVAEFPDNGLIHGRKEGNLHLEVRPGCTAAVPESGGTGGATLNVKASLCEVVSFDF
jgi:hypothetical protein